MNDDFDTVRLFCRALLVSSIVAGIIFIGISRVFAAPNEYQVLAERFNLSNDNLERAERELRAAKKAAKAYNEAAKKLFGEFAYLNQITK